jgi:hypothetical protein
LSRRLVINIIRKDWFEFRKTIFLMTAAMLLPVFAFEGSRDFIRGVFAGYGVSAAYCFAYFSFSSERQRGTLNLLLSFPVRPADLVLAKYVSLYSMTLFGANLPGILLGDFYFLLLLNAFVIFLSTLSMSFTVMSDKPWAAIIPMWFVLIFFMPIRKVFERFFPDGLALIQFLGEHITLWAGLAIATTPFIALGSAYWFERSLRE